MEFNEQQQRAIDATGRNITVFASAGAGKTTLLIARLIKRMKQDGLKISEICAMTFTEAAASEMKKRLAQALALEKSEYLQEQLTLLPSANISTIHSFCLFLIQNYGYIIGLDPRMSTHIMSEGTQKQLQKQALQIIHEEARTTFFQDYLDCLTYFSPRPSDTQSFDKMCLKLVDFLAQDAYPDELAQRIKTSYNADAFGELPEQLQTVFWSYYRNKLEQLITKTYTCIRAYDDDQVNKAEELALLQGMLQGLKTALDQLNDHDLGFLEYALNSVDVQFSRILKVPGYAAARKDLAALINTFVSHLYPLNQRFTHQQSLSGVIETLLACAAIYQQAYTTLKQAQQTMDFNDLEHYALRILKAQDGYVSHLMQDKFMEVLVDEYQDTNPVQDEIIRAISNGYNTFRVGDVKQSIYGFRGAKPDLMREFLKPGIAHHEQIFLASNYRSKEDIVEFNNRLFTKLMNITGLKDQYTEQDWVSTGSVQQKEASVPVSVHLIQALDEEESNDDEPADMKQRKAIHIANEMIRLHQENYQWKDMVVLVRAHNTKRDLKKAFDAANIPCFIDDQSGFYQSPIVQDILNLCELSLNPQDDYLLFCALSSAFYGLSDQQCALLKLTGKPLWKAIESGYPAIYQSLKASIAFCQKATIHEAVAYCMQLNNVYQEMLSIQEKTNVDFLFQKAIECEQNGQSGLLSFLDYVNYLKDEKSSQAIPVSSDDDVVKVVTIHQSKGLQYPVVFFWSTAQRKTLELMDPLIMDGELGVGLNTMDLTYRFQHKTLIRELIEYKLRSEEVQEVIRLLYVALTRAQNQMIIVDSDYQKNLPELDQSIVFDNIPYTALILSALDQSSIHAGISLITTVEPLLNPQSAEDKSSEIRYFQADKASNKTMRASHEIEAHQALELDFENNLKQAMDTGTLLHKVLEEMPHEPWSEKMLTDRFPKLTESQVKRLLIYNQDEFTQILYEKDIKSEFNFIVNIEGQALYGIIDFLAIDKYSVTLVDFKSDQCDLKTLVERHRPQIDAYNQALQYIYPELSRSAYLYSLYHSTYVKVI